MADLPAVALPALRLEVDDLLALDDAVDGKDDLRALHIRRSNLEGGSVRHGQNRRQLGVLPRLDRDLFNLDPLADLDKRLLAAGLEHCVFIHFSFPFFLAFLVERTPPRKAEGV